MPRRARLATGGLVYHVLNRGNARATLFEDEGDYAAFERVLGEALGRTPLELFAWCLMPNHWHMVLRPAKGEDLPQFMRWLSVTHTQRWHAHHHTSGTGHLYQGRYKSFPVQDDLHFLIVCRYVQRNALRAGLVIGPSNGAGRACGPDQLRWDGNPARGPCNAQATGSSSPTNRRPMRIGMPCGNRWPRAGPFGRKIGKTG